MHIQDEKAHLRQSIKDRILRMSDGDRAAESRSICRRIIENMPEGTKIVCGYVALKDEVDLQLAIDELLQHGIELYLPRFDRMELTFRQVTDMKSLIPGELNIREPGFDCPLLERKNADVILVPGRAFDRGGYRIGRGNGGYDKWISKQRTLNPQTKYWGIAFECQLLNEIPTEPHDEKMDMIMTARGTLLS